LLGEDDIAVENKIDNKKNNNNIIVGENNNTKSNNNNNNDDIIEENNIMVSSQLHNTKYYTDSIVKIKFEFTDEEYSKIQQLFQDVLNNNHNNIDNINKEEDLKQVVKNFLYENDSINSMNLFNIFLLHQHHLYYDDDSINNNNAINNNNIIDNNFTLSLNILYKIFYNKNSEEEQNNSSSNKLLLLEINKNDEEEELQSIFKNRNKNKKNNNNKEFIDEFIVLLTKFYDILTDINNDIEKQKKYQNMFNFNGTMSLLNELIKKKSLNNIDKDYKNSELILEIIIFFVEFHDKNDKSDKYHVLILEKNNNEELDCLINIRNKYKRSWWLMTPSSKFLNNKKNDKISINTLQNYFTGTKNTINCILTFEKEYNILNFYEFDIFSIWNQLNSCFDLFLDEIISQHQTELNTISYFEERLKKEEKEKEEQKLFLTNLKSIIMNKEDEVSLIIDNLRTMMQNMNI